MPKKKDKDSTEFWRGKFRELEKEVRQLRKQLKYYTSRNHLAEDIIQTSDEIITDSEDTAPRKKVCGECARGHLDEFEIAGKIFATCNICGHRLKLKG